ncbi:MAG: aminodeoxychorismate synthase, component I [Leptospiraceae bacterium]|nr:MAG: aminodeoxychorismate synthase, component I [Leptospiraceae bacterium]
MKIIFPITLEELKEIKFCDISYNKNKFFWIVFENPVQKIILKNTSSIESILHQINTFFNILETSQYYFAGFFSYELGYYLLSINQNQNKTIFKDFPLIYGGFFSSYKIYEDYFELISDYKLKENYINHFQILESYKNYKKNIIKIKNLIKRGNVYQINYTFPIKVHLYGNIYKLFYLLGKMQISDKSAMIIDKDFYILSLSPELFFYQNDEHIILKPMKGTYKKSSSLREIIKGIQYLKNSSKEKSENAMIVDLIRNDLGRISKIGTVKIENLYKIEIYETIIQMISEISSLLQYSPKTKLFWQSLFPSGSVTGAPKISAMRFIEQLETYKRNVYTGSIGWIINHTSKFNVAIRTLIGKKNTAYYYTGSGITYDSNPKKEFMECINKAKLLKQLQKELKPDYIFTTMKYSGGIIYFEKSHIQRLINTKNFFQFPIKEQKIINAFSRLKKHLEKISYPIRIHFRIYKNGKIYIKLNKLNYKKNIKICLSNKKINPENIFLYFKTSNREIYTKEFDFYKKLGYEEVLFQNKEGFITEGSFTNIIIKIKNEFYTPPKEAGILNGILRQKLIQKGRVKEKNITLVELKEANQIYLINSVRGIIKGYLT